jgi:hypothetical protein
MTVTPAGATGGRTYRERDDGRTEMGDRTDRADARQ